MKFRVLINRKKKGESMNQIFFNYGLREHPKRTQKSPLDDRLGTRTRKRLVGCEECGKGFRYEKCLAKHREVMHSLKPKKCESMRSDLLCIFSSGVQRRKRSKRVSRYKKSPSVSYSSSFTKSPVSEDDGELLEVAQSLIMLSKSGEALVSNQRECEDGFLGNEFKLVGISTESDGTSKELLGFLGDKKSDESGQQVGAGSSGLGIVSLDNAETDTKQKLGCQEAVFEVSNTGSKGFQMKTEHQCRLCDRVFSTYQALGGHQTSHRVKKKSEKSKHEIERVISRS